MIAILRTAKRACRLLLICVCVSGCAGSGSTAGTTSASAAGARGDMNAAMSSWKGRRAYEAVAMWGMPDSITREGALGMLRWRADAAAIGDKPWGQPFYGADGQPQEPQQRRKDWPMRCARVLSVDVQEIVQYANWSRSEGCSTDPTDYLPPP
ncbi:MAG: hypothetical protein K0Q76_4107 [Panacagrimonas sp.]|jgi:hypothetical protein|nr:hypothetical protein [Panacagrimonas sp.]MCC2658999.1 hypothetical protein [Panacagrimonas sp.]